MPYISTEAVAEKRKRIKEAFPNWKFSITRDNYSSIYCDILEADIDLLEGNDRAESGNCSVNHIYIADHYKNQPEVAKALQTIADILTDGEKEESYDGDYGIIPTFYVNLRIGQWNRPFKVVKAELKVQKIQKTIVVAPVTIEGKVSIIDYSEKAIAVVGDTKPIKETLKQLGGRFNAHLTCGIGWIFPKTKETQVRETLMTCCK